MKISHRRVQNVIKKIFSKEEKVKDRNTEIFQDSEVLYIGSVSAEPKKVKVKINIDKEGRFFLDENGKEVVMLDADENYIKKISTESKKVQEILKRYYQD